MRLKRHVMNITLGIVVGLVLLVILVRVFENRLIFFPPRYPEGFSSPVAYGIHPEEIWLTASGGVKLNAYFIAAPDSPKVLLWFHGNAENIGMGLDHLKWLSRLGVNVMELDYRGYGKSEGSPDEAGVYRDADAAYLYLVEGRKFAPKDVYVYGHSLGGAVAVDLASRRECGGLIVESSFTSIPDMARHIYRVPVARYLPSSRFDSLAKIARVNEPVLIIHGTRDPVIPFEMGRRLFEAAREPKAFLPVEGAEHDDPYVVGGEAYFKRMDTFIRGTSPES
ncbi:MAG TPA: alpha/beta hydrolase [Terriglobia bacterium]|nr:alpha/beta hydrolase [Terriglobia bacterium]